MLTNEPSSNVPAYFAKLLQYAAPDRERCSLELNISDDENGNQFIGWDGKSSSLSASPEGKADITITSTRATLEGVVAGQSMLLDLFREGKVQVVGDVEMTWAILHQRIPAEFRYCETVSRQTPPSDIKRIERPKDADAFRRTYVEVGQPVVITNMMATWPHFPITWDEVVKHAGDTTIRVLDVPNERRVPLREALELFRDPNLPQPPPYASNVDVPKSLYVSPPDLLPAELYREPRFWVGPVGATTRLHRDHTDNFHSVFLGRKKFTLIPPHHREHLYVWQWPGESRYDYCEVDPVSPDLSRFPKFAKVDSVFEVELRPGDTLFLPDGWFHRVETLEMSMAMNFWPLADHPCGMRTPPKGD